MRRLFLSPLGACAPPQAPNKKEIAPAVLAAIIAGGATLVGAAGNTISQANSNNANRDIAKQTNDTNMQINRENLAAQRELYNSARVENRFLVDQAYQRELENRNYNSPQNQMQLYRQAGLNPYLQGSLGSVGGSYNMSVPTGSAPQASVPSSIPMQTGAPIQPLNFDGFGLAAQNAVNTYLQSKQDDRQDYALANDIEVSRLNAQSNYLNAVTKAKEAGVNELYIRSSIEDAERNYWLNVDKNDQQREFNMLSHNLNERALSIKAYEAETSRLAAKSNIALNQASIGKIAQEIEESKNRVIEMRVKGASQQEIDGYIASREKSLAKIVKIESEKVSRRADNTGMNIYQDFVGGLLDPLKGLVSVGGKF